MRCEMGKKASWKNKQKIPNKVLIEMTFKILKKKEESHQNKGVQTWNKNQMVIKKTCMM